MNIIDATAGYERWVATQVPVVRTQLTDKHQRMGKNIIQFLRGTFYRWTQLWPELCPELTDAPQVLAVGDLHVASFGTWRDAFGRLIWGIDDFDEAYPLPYTSDLVRLAVSAALEAEETLGIGTREICELILDGYSAGQSSRGRPFVLEEHHKWLRARALDHLDKPAVFWEKLRALPVVRKAIPAKAKRALRGLLPEQNTSFTISRRVAGMGSLGRPRYVAIADWRGGSIALEAKAAIPSACSWYQNAKRCPIHYEQILKCAIRCPDPAVRFLDHWVVRRLAPDSSPIEIESMKSRRNQRRLLHAMAFETANIHLGSTHGAKEVVADLASRPDTWLRRAVKTMVEAIHKDWKLWKTSR